MCAVSQERLAASGRSRRQRQRAQRRRTTLLAAVVAVVLASVAVALIKVRQTIGAQEAAVASPVASVDPGIGNKPPSRIIAAAGPVEINLPVDRKFAKFTLFRPIDKPHGVAITPDESWTHEIWPTPGVGPRTAGLDIAAPPGTIVYSPIDGRISGVQPFVLAGRTAGYQIDISPDAASDVVVRMQYLIDIPIERGVTDVCGTAGVLQPEVGTIVNAGQTCLGQVLDVNQDLGDVARPLIARYTSDGGNHVHLEVLRVGS